MRLFAAALFAVALAGCGQKADRATINAPGGGENSSVPMSNMTAEENSGSSAASDSSLPGPAKSSGAANGFGSLPPPNAPLRFVGTWAASKADCPAKFWRFTRTRVSAVNGPHCSIYKVDEVPGGYDLAVQCPAKKPVPTDLIKLRFAESARAMLIESNAIAPTGLVYCGK